MTQIDALLYAAEKLKSLGRRPSTETLYNHALMATSPKDLRPNHLLQASRYIAVNTIGEALLRIPSKDLSEVSSNLRDWPLRSVLLPKNAIPVFGERTSFIPHREHVVFVPPATKATTRLGDLAQEMARQGVWSSLVVPEATPPTQQKSEGPDRVALTLPTSTDWVRQGERQFEPLRDEFARIRADIIVSAADTPTALVAFLAARESGRPFMLDVAAVPSMATDYLLQQIALRADHVFHSDHAMGHQLVSLGVPRDQISWLPDWNMEKDGILYDAAQAVQVPMRRLSAQAARRPQGQVKASEHNFLGTVGWPDPPVHSPLTAMTIVDTFTQDCLAPEMNMIQPRPDNWKGLMERDFPELLFVESAWQGNGGSWQYRVAHYANPPGDELASMTQGFRTKKVPSVFWNKEDPIHFDKFCDAAPLFDHVFTTALEAVPQYKEIGCESVHVMPFAAQPALHNPIGSAMRNGRICFAGSYYANRFGDRQREQLTLLEAASHLELDIFDRNAGMKGDFNFPPHLNKFVRGKLTYSETCEAYRKYSIFLNVNSINDSKTMFSRRVFELLACGTPVISTPSPGIEEMFGEDTVFIVRDGNEAREAIAHLHGNPEIWRERSLRGIRKVFRSHCFHHRLDAMFDVAGIDQRVSPQVKCAVLAFGSGPDAAHRLQDAAATQVIPGGKLCFHFLDTGKEVPNRDAWGKIQSQLTAQGITHATVMLDGISYAPHCIEDMSHALTYAKAKVITKAQDQAQRYNYVDKLDARAWIISLEDLCQAVRFRRLDWMTNPKVLAEHLADTFSGSVFACGGDGFEPLIPSMEV